jgi:N-acylneuraminate cytidylyltransferase
VKLAVIPARGGSKRIPRKNIRPFAGKPIIVWSIEAAVRCGCFDRIAVSTDDEEIADIARGAGAEVPFKRPAELSDDHTGTIAVVRHAVRTLIDPSTRDDLVCCIYPTAPFIVPDDLRLGLQTLERLRTEFALSVTRFGSPIQRAVRIDDHGRLSMFDPGAFNTRSQDLEAAYHDAAQFYWGRATAWLEAETLFGPSSGAVVLPTYRVQDIDTPEDWRRAELMFGVLRAQP